MRKARENPVVTTVHLKTDADEPRPVSAPMSYVLSGSGLFIQRHTEFFTSCVPARRWPAELADQDRFLESRYPKIRRRQFERIVGFFSLIGSASGGEAIVLLYWNRRTRRIEIVVPPQVAIVSRGNDGRGHPIGLDYEMPLPASPELVPFGDIHSHVQLPAYSSGTDVHDEIHRPGLHIVLGKLHLEPPDIHVEAVVDGERFPLQAEQVIGGYRGRNLRVPEEWRQQVRVEYSHGTVAGHHAAERPGTGLEEDR